MHLVTKKSCSLCTAHVTECFNFCINICAVISTKELSFLFSSEKEAKSLPKNLKKQFFKIDRDLGVICNTSK